MAKLYTELLREGKIRTDKSMSEKNDQPTEMERVLALLSDTDRAIVEERLIAMSKAAMEAKKSNVAAAPFASSADQQVRYSAHRDEEHMDAHRRFFLVDGKDVDLSKAKSSTQAKSRVYEVIKDSDKMQGVLTKDTYMCPKCDCIEVYAYLEQTRSSDEPETRMLTCKDCGNGWREY